MFLIDAFETGIEEGEGDEDEEEDGRETTREHLFETLQRLMQARGLAVSDVEHFFGNAHLTKEVLRPASGRSRVARLKS